LARLAVRAGRWFGRRLATPIQQPAISERLRQANGHRGRRISLALLRTTQRHDPERHHDGLVGGLDIGAADAIGA
jgi:hypothetical protein